MNLIELKNVTKKYGDFKALDNISFKIKKGEIVGFLGQNGAGKTTTMKLITGLIEPTEGEVLINDKLLDKKNKTKIGYMPENVPLYNSLTVREFIDFMGEIKKIKKKERKKEVDELINKLHLSDVENKIIKNISRGYKQRTSLAGALIGNPEILVLDEPTVGLDPKQIIEIRNFIKELKNNHTILLSTHILSEANQICEKVIIIDKGKIIATDTPENLEKKTNKNIVNVIIEDPKNNIKKIKEKIEEIKEINFINNNDNNEKEYQIIVNGKEDIRKKIMKVFPEFDITIIELKKDISSLEEAFVSLINEEEEK